MINLLINHTLLDFLSFHSIFLTVVLEITNEINCLHTNPCDRGCLGKKSNENTLDSSQDIFN